MPLRMRTSLAHLSRYAPSMGSFGTNYPIIACNSLLRRLRSLITALFHYYLAPDSLVASYFANLFAVYFPTLLHIRSPRKLGSLMCSLSISLAHNSVAKMRSYSALSRKLLRASYSLPSSRLPNYFALSTRSPPVVASLLQSARSYFPFSTCSCLIH